MRMVIFNKCDFYNICDKIKQSTLFLQHPPQYNSVTDPEKNVFKLLLKYPSIKAISLHPLPSAVTDPVMDLSSFRFYTHPETFESGSYRLPILKPPSDEIYKSTVNSFAIISACFKTVSVASFCMSGG